LGSLTASIRLLFLSIFLPEYRGWITKLCFYFLFAIFIP
jgi:hypothetical protein